MRTSSQSNLSLPRRPIASLRFWSHNLGDDIQAYAVEQSIPCDLTLDRERLDREHDPCDLLLFGWLMHSENWPPHPGHRVHPLSIHVAHQRREMMAHCIDWWRSRGPIPCRDGSTAEFFLGQGVEAMLEGCATLSLKRWLAPVKNLVVIVDAVAPNGMPPLGFRRVVEQTHFVPRPHHRNPKYRARMTERVLRAYQRAEMVVTSRLHALLPCLAFGTPVLFLPPPMCNRPSNYTRFIDYLPYVECWDGRTPYETQGRLPINHHPTALVEGVQRRLASIKATISRE